MYGQIVHPETGHAIASVQDGVVTANNGKTYKLDGQRLVDEAGEIVGYVSTFIGKAEGSGALASKLFGG